MNDLLDASWIENEISGKRLLFIAAIFSGRVSFVGFYALYTVILLPSLARAQPSVFVFLTRTSLHWGLAPN